MSDRRKSHRSSGIYKAFVSSEVHYPKDIIPFQTADSLERWRNVAHGINSLAQNINSLARIHCALGERFNESFASFLYGLLITMFCNNFPESPNKELYEHKSIKGLSSRIETLQDRVRLAKAKNQQLRSELERRNRDKSSSNVLGRSESGLESSSKDARHYSRQHSRQHSRQAKTELETPTRLRGRNPLFQKPLPKASMIQKPTAFQKSAINSSKSSQKVSVAVDDTYSTNDSFLETPIADPNLNQPPRYMRGLFDKSASANMRRNIEKRVPLGKPNRINKPIRGGAARRAQRARESRLNTRPPFR